MAMIVTSGIDPTGHGGPDNARRRDGGYTLFEMLIVLALVAVAVGFAVPAVSSGSQHSSLRKAEATVLQVLRTARAEAIRTNRESWVHLDLDSNAISTSFGEALVLNGAVTGIDFTTARALVDGPERGGLLFLPDGTSTGGRIVLHTENLSRVIEVDWITGMVRTVDDG